MDSFIKKYSALTGMDDENIKGLFKFRPAMIGTTMCVHGAEFKFFYSLHSIPCIGFEVSFSGKTMYFSGDTFYEPTK
jgi:hypothetical protein